MKDMKVKDIVMKVIDVLYNIIVGSLTIIGKMIVFLIALAQSGSVDKSKSSVNFIFSEVKSDDVVEFSPKVNVEFEIVEPLSKRQELEDSLRYLKSKTNKTIQDKNSIGIIEAVLKNM